MSQATNLTDWPRRVSWLAAILVGLLALLSFILSYSSLRDLALANGVGFWLSFIWPLLLDFSMVVCSVVILRASLRGDKARWPWVLTGTYTGLAVLGNILDVASLGIPPGVVQAGVKALAALTCFVTFELLMGMVHSEVKRSSDPKGPTKGQRPTLLRSRHSAKTESGQGDTPGQKAKAPVTPDLVEVTGRREQVLALLSEGLKGPEIAARLGVSERTVKRDRQALNGRAKDVRLS